MALITKDEIRQAFTPALSTDDISDAELDTKIAIIEDYVSARYFNDEAIPTTVKYPCMLLVLSKIIANAAIAKKYGIPESVSIGDFKYTLSVSGRGQHVTAWESSRSWDMMAHDMLRARGNSSYRIYKSND